MRLHTYASVCVHNNNNNILCKFYALKTCCYLGDIKLQNSFSFFGFLSNQKPNWDTYIFCSRQKDQPKKNFRNEEKRQFPLKVISVKHYEPINISCIKAQQCIKMKSVKKKLCMQEHFSFLGKLLKSIKI